MMKTCLPLPISWSSLLLLMVIRTTTTMAVDHGKFRTCAQTSFCRRHRLPLDSNSNHKSGGGGRYPGPTYKINIDSIKIKELLTIDSAVVGKDDTGGAGGASSGTEDVGGGGGGGGTEKQGVGGGWKSFFTGSSKKSKDENDGGSDPYYRGSTPLFTASLDPIITDEVAPIGGGGGGSNEENSGYPSLDIALSWYTNGNIRLRITEPYGPYKVPSKEKVFPARWTYDELVLTEISSIIDNNKFTIRKLSKDEIMKRKFLEVLSTNGDVGGGGGGKIDAEHYLGLEWKAKESEEEEKAGFAAAASAAAFTPTVVILRLDSFELHLFTSSSSSSSNGTNKPVVSLNTQKLLHYEHYRDKPSPEEMEAVEKERRRLQEIRSKKEEEHKRRHGDKKVVGYWEDGLAIYSDGSREEKKEDDKDEDESGDHDEDSHDKDSKEDEHDEPDVAAVAGGGAGLHAHHDTKGMWEESFHEHKDSKPHGPSSVGMDVTFPSSKHLYGLPEHASSLTLKKTRGNGHTYTDPYRLYNLDVFEYDLDVPMALYGSVPLVIAHNEEQTVGVFWFNPTETFVDIFDDNANDATEEEQQHDSNNNGMITHWISESGIIDLFILPGPTPSQIHSQYSSLTGYQELPPIFALGYHQCRWNYRDEKDVYHVHSKFEELDYPYDVLWLDIEHTDGKRYFTWDDNSFPNPKKMQEDLNAQGRKMVTIVDPHIKRDDKYRIHQEATKKGYYIKDNTGTKDFDGWCWPGSSSYLDFTKDTVRKWWAEQFQYDKYVGSTPSLYTWNDMNEPSVFNGPEVSMSKDLLNLDGIEHRQWHNLYGMLFHRATSEGLINRNPDKNDRPFVLSRSFFAGSQKYGAIWTGDNAAEWSHLSMATSMLLSLSLGGIQFVGADVGGFFGNTNAELMTRWMQAGSYQPFFRGHAHHDAKRREPWMFDDDTLIRLRRSSMARYALLPYIYTTFWFASKTGMPIMRPLWMEYTKVRNLFDLDDQWLLGSDLLIKPVTQAGISKVNVIFPTENTWYDVDTMESVPILGLGEEGTGTGTGTASLEVDCPIDKIPVYQKGGSIIPRRLRLRRSTACMHHDPYTLYIALEEHNNNNNNNNNNGEGQEEVVLAKGMLYMDDGKTFNYRSKKQYAVAIFQMNKNGILSCDVTFGSNDNETDSNNNQKWKDEELSNHEIERIVIMGKSNGTKKISIVSSSSSEIEEELTFTYSEQIKVLVIRKPNLSAMSNWKIRME